jgi:hypothetical protein
MSNSTFEDKKKKKNPFFLGDLARHPLANNTWAGLSCCRFSNNPKQQRKKK